jgi:Phosphodiester glycosidase
MARVKIFRRAGAAALVLVLTLIAVAPGGAGGYRSRSTELAPGVVYTKIRDPRGPWSIRVVSVLLSEASTIEPVLATGKLPGYETTTSMAARYGALAAINGDYARESGRPVMLFAQDGELAQTALTRGVNFAVNSTETSAYIQHQKPEMWLREADTGFDHTVNFFNAGWPGGDHISGFSALGGRDEKPPSGACSVRMYPTEGFHNSSTRLGIEQTHVVNDMVCKGGTMWPKKGRVFSTPIAGTKAYEITSMTPGEEVSFGWSLGWPDVFDTIGGNPTLVRNGEIFIERNGVGGFFNRHPRTGVGITADGRVLFVTVDGRRQGYSIGMTPWRFGQLFLSLGATYALNLDGGGSTTMVVNGQIVNRPSDDYERPVSSALLLLPGPDPAPTTSPGPIPTATPTPSPSPTTTALPPVTRPVLTPDELWMRIASDPASTGGLADWLLREGVHLSRPLMRAALLYRNR